MSDALPPLVPFYYCDNIGVTSGVGVHHENTPQAIVKMTVSCRDPKTGQPFHLDLLCAPEMIGELSAHLIDAAAAAVHDLAAYNEQRGDDAPGT